MLECKEVELVSGAVSEDEVVELISSGIGKLIGSEVVLNCLLETSLSYDMDELVEGGTAFSVSYSIEIRPGLVCV